MARKAKRARISAPVRKVMNEAGFTREAAAELYRDLKQQASNHKVTSNAAAKAAKQRKEDFVRQSRLGITNNGKRYLNRMNAVEQAMKDLAKFGIVVPDFIDYAEAAAEGRYEEALKLNKKAVDKAKQDTEAAIDAIKQEMPRLHGDELIEAREQIKFFEQRIDALVSMFGSGKAMNLKNTSIGRKIDKLFG